MIDSVAKKIRWQKYLIKDNLFPMAATSKKVSQAGAAVLGASKRPIIKSLIENLWKYHCLRFLAVYNLTWALLDPQFALL